MTTPPGPVTSQEAHVRETGVIVPFELPVTMDQPKHLPHLDNFFRAVQGQAELRCPGDAALAAERVVYAINDDQRAVEIVAIEHRADAYRRK